VFSDRALRTKFRWSLTSSFFTKVFLAVLMCSAIETFLTENFDPYYLRMAKNKSCYFLVPVWDYSPNVCIYLASRFFLASKVRATATIQRNEDDYFGISRELKFVSLVSSFLIIVYEIYIYICFVSHGKLAYTSACFILFTSYFLAVAFAVVVPVCKIIQSKTKQQRNRGQNLKLEVAVSPHRSRRRRSSQVSSILSDETLVRQFHEHAQKHLCAENVDFCVEVNAFKKEGEDFVECGCSKRNEKLHQMYERIVAEFVCNDSPSEVNLSSIQKNKILSYRQLEHFSALESSLMFSIFDGAKAEIEKLLEDNICQTFFENSH